MALRRMPEPSRQSALEMLAERSAPNPALCDRPPTEEEIEVALAWVGDGINDFWTLMNRWAGAPIGPATAAALEPIDQRRAEVHATIRRLVSALKAAGDHEERGVLQAERDEARRERDEAREVLRLFRAYVARCAGVEVFFTGFDPQHPIWAMVAAVAGPYAGPIAGPVFAFINLRNRKTLAELEAAAALPPIARAGRAARWG